MHVLLGANGQITSRLARHLLAAGHRVRVVGRHAAHLAPLVEAGAEARAGDPGDPAFLAQAFADAAGVYTMVPPCYGEPRMRAAQDRIGAAIAEALARVPVPRVVNLSSVGAELPAGTGPIEALHAQEQRLDALGGTDLLHLRPGAFMENLLPLADVVATAGVLPGMEAPDARFPMVSVRDVAAVAAGELVRPRHRGVLVLHAPEHRSMRQAAAVLGAAIGHPDLPYVQTSEEEGQAALRAQGLSADAAAQLAALARWLSSSPVASAAAAPVAMQPMALEGFARGVFAPAFERALRGAPAHAAAGAS